MNIPKHLVSFFIGIIGAVFASLVTIQVNSYRVSQLEEDLATLLQRQEEQARMIHDNSIGLAKATTHLADILTFLNDNWKKEN